MGELVQLNARYNLRHNYLSLVAAILVSRPLTPDQALNVVYGVKNGKKHSKPRQPKYTEQDISDIEAMRTSGMKWDEIGEAMGISGDSAHHALKRYRKAQKNLPLVIGK